MPLTIEQIPDLETAPGSPASPGAPGAPGAGRPVAMTGLKLPARRRTVLRAVALGALTLGASALDWTGAVRTRRARAEIGRFGLPGWDRTDCRDAYPDGYDQEADTSGEYVTRPAACFGGTFLGSDFCEGGWHKFGTYTDGGVRVDHVPITTACGATTTKNAWRWTTPDGITYRCSDGYSTYWSTPNTSQTYGTICRSAL
jgi:hypothetical protein